MRIDSVYVAVLVSRQLEDLNTAHDTTHAGMDPREPGHALRYRRDSI